ncbi:hypothetical protein A0J61_06463 [Choanephora cucurbitarum]|uniref:Uncharacterized protein n=1 Tax=Choanephora cucurbitarum TaxID=101091 RepID=A0A1C7N8S5_9FUNG|nr:hypothetical protein A0J61_06463 [Choanephora cucurbitarum]
MPFPEQQKKQTKAKRISTVNIADTKSINIMPHVLFSCDMMCIQHLNYVHWLEKEDDMELEKLDIILNPHSCLEIHCHFLLNGLHHVLTYPSWFHMALNYTMHQCGLSLLRQADNIYHYEMKKAFMTPPLSYLMDQQVPYGSLDRIDLVFDWTTNKPKEFQTVWKRERLSSDLFVRYMQDALYQLVIRKTCYQYPLIFSNHYVKKLSSIMSYLPHIAHSFQKIYTTSKSTMSVNNHDFAHTLGDKLKTIKMNTDVMNPYNEEEEEKITTHLVLGMYHTIKTAHKMRTCPTQKVVIDPPNAMCTVAKLWSTTACTSSLAHTQRP